MAKEKKTAAPDRRTDAEKIRAMSIDEVGRLFRLEVVNGVDLLSDFGRAFLRGGVDLDGVPTGKRKRSGGRR